MTPLCNGVDLTGWWNVNCAPGTWTVRDGVISCTGVPVGMLRTERCYENFVLELEWRHREAGGNSGVFVWSDALPARGQPFPRAIEVQVMDGHEGEGFTSDGDVFPIHGATMVPGNGRGGQRAFPTERRVHPAPEWNHYRIECNDGAITLAVNGKVVTSGRECSPRKGYISLESEGSPVEFRNLRIRELPASAPPLAPAHVAALDAGFTPLYTGVDFAGWKFGDQHRGHWAAADWHVDFDGEGADLWTEREYGDFVLMCDWRWLGTPVPTERPVILPSGDPRVDEHGAPVNEQVPDAGDSGIYLRGSSKSQVNIWCWPIGSGEVYGYRTDSSMSPEVRAAVTPKAKADAPIGHWNRFVITMQGDRLTVQLNGQTVIEQAALPGIAPRGAIALQKHGGAIQFANLYIKELDAPTLIGRWTGRSPNAQGWVLELRSDGAGALTFGGSSFALRWTHDPEATPMTLDLTGFAQGPLAGKTLWGIVELIGGDTLRWDSEAGAPNDADARPRELDPGDARILQRAR
jgi:hypothetical protein